MRHTQAVSIGVVQRESQTNTKQWLYTTKELIQKLFTLAGKEIE